MSSPPLLRWGLLLSLAAIALALFLRPADFNDQVQAIIAQFPLPSQSESQTFCYQGVRTPSGSDVGNCFTVRDGKFSDVFTSGPEDEVKALPGYAYPGLWDAHGHLLQYGEFLHSVDLFGSEEVEEVRRRVGVYLDEHPGVGGRDEWIRGVGWDQMVLGGMPTAVCFCSVTLDVLGEMRG